MATRDDAVGHPGSRLEQGHPEQVARESPTHLDRSGHDVWAVRLSIPRVVARGERDGVRQDIARCDAVAAEEGERVPALVLEQSLVAESVDRDDVTRSDREHRGIR
ncbi:hypothetical protein [Cryobacterium breve]|uniref:hypothetical protein n=1 Tax=Cryobacterium breve TaxID=1259258 RepID=UPI0032B1B39A